MPTPAAYTILAFGATAFLAGLSMLLLPALASLPLPLPAEGDQAYCRPASNGNALAAVAMGLYYALAAWQENAAFFRATVPVRLLTAAVFWAQGWRGPAAWEGGGALLTAAALVLGRDGGAGGMERRGRTRVRED